MGVVSEDQMHPAVRSSAAVPALILDHMLGQGANLLVVHSWGPMEFRGVVACLRESRGLLTDGGRRENWGRS